MVDDGMVAAVEAGGGRVVDAGEAEGIVWTNPRDPQGLKDTLEESPATWVQLPFAGIESFVAAGVIDPRLTWTCAKGAYGRACAEQALALMFAGARRLAHHARATTWREPGFGSPERQLDGSTVLIFGAGGIGQALIEMLEPYEVSILAVNRSGRDVPGAERTVAMDGARDLLGDADHVVIAAALTDETRAWFDGDAFARMRSDAVLINVARGGIVDTDALVDALKGGEIGGAGLDVTDPEPLPDGHPLWDLDNVMITPHIANTWDMALPALRALVERNVANFAAGRPLEGPVDPALGY
jgi:phosphoglycerate dehydrogenase-like enzyme